VKLLDANIPQILGRRSVTDDATQRRRLRKSVEQSRQLQSDAGSCRPCFRIYP